MPLRRRALRPLRGADHPSANQIGAGGLVLLRAPYQSRPVGCVTPVGSTPQGRALCTHHPRALYGRRAYVRVPVLPEYR